ncbi:MAG: hypothetical protein B6D37_08075 [Sphingobacteriales bacterium UTBCD1]|jgi:hypothetical protein|nr:MAG: hypothetical protein B6D37_08075 [Sphingobacteriales bacterium UTBCD1]
MERIGALINKLKEQFDENADAAQMQMTIQLLQQELNQLQQQAPRTLGTSKVAVVFPSVAPPIAPQYEKYAPKTAGRPAVQEIKETVLVDKGSVSVVQKNMQLDMVFDPMTEIPTLSHQPKGKEVNEVNAGQSESLNDKLRGGKTELFEVLKETPVKDLRKAIGINDRYVFINELFRGDEAMYERCIKTINNFNIYPEAEFWIARELKTKLGWDNNNETVKLFDQLIKRRFS